MADRITRKLIEKRLEQLNKAMDNKPGDNAYYTLDICSWGGADYKVESHSGSTNVSPRGTGKEIFNFVGGMLAGVQAMASHSKV